MKIVDRKTFLSMPAETLYCKYAPCYFEELEIKGDTIGSNDFASQSIADAVKCRDSGDFSAVLHNSMRTGASVEFDFYCQGRDGFFDDEQLFAVWERHDVAALIERLKEAL